MSDTQGNISLLGRLRQEPTEETKSSHKVGILSAHSIDFTLELSNINFLVKCPLNYFLFVLGILRGTFCIFPLRE